MVVLSLKGNQVRLSLRDRQVSVDRKSRSAFQESVKKQLLDQYPQYMLFEEVFIPEDNLYLDFFIPALGIVVECQGRQHTEHIKFFHSTKREFNQQKLRDSKKKLWCELNNFKLIEIHHAP